MFIVQFCKCMKSNFYTDVHAVGIAASPTPHASPTRRKTPPPSTPPPTSVLVELRPTAPAEGLQLCLGHVPQPDLRTKRDSTSQYTKNPTLTMMIHKAETLSEDLNLNNIRLKQRPQNDNYMHPVFLPNDTKNPKKDFLPTRMASLFSAAAVASIAFPMFSCSVVGRNIDMIVTWASVDDDEGGGDEEATSCRDRFACCFCFLMARFASALAF